jgi:hypothetical protein
MIIPTYDLQPFDDLNALLNKIYIDLDIKNLSEVKFSGEDSITLFDNVLNRKATISPLPFWGYKLFDELDLITKDLKYITGILFLLQPYINNVQHFQNNYNQNFEDRQYLMYANFGLQTLYNFWDRIGDLINVYFETGLKPTDIYLAKVLNNINPIYKQSVEYKKLKSICENELRHMLTNRNQAVHYFQLDTKYRWGNIENYNDGIKQTELNLEKHQLANEMKQLLNLSLQGYKLAIDFINILPDTKLIFKLERIYLSDRRFKVKSLDLHGEDHTPYLKNHFYQSTEDLKKEISKIQSHYLESRIEFEYVL